MLLTLGLLATFIIIIIVVVVLFLSIVTLHMQEHVAVVAPADDVTQLRTAKGCATEVKTDSNILLNVR